jgi:hypothetical protein
MSYTRSNLYASRVYAEHPVATWSMDEQNYYVSLISEQEKEITSENWTLDNATLSASVFDLSGYPFDNLDVNKLYLTLDSPKEFKLSLSSSVMYSEIDQSKGSICTSSYIYIPGTTSILYVDIGFIVGGQEHYSRYTKLKINNWEKISYTYDMSEEDNFNPFIRVHFDADADAGEIDTSVYFNSVSVGQWSEPYNSISTGVFEELIALPEIPRSLIDFIGTIKCTVLDPYGFNDSSDNGYVLSVNNSLLAKLSGIPMVYGSAGNIRLNKDAVSEEDNFPSLVFPGKGFLNQSGYNKALTAEFWLRISPETLSKKRIFGPLMSEDGLYVDKDFITINVGKYTKSYFIGKWYRPMLVHFSQSLTEIFLMINGEKVISIPIDSLEIETFPQESEDYLGFYTHDDIYVYEIDCFSIFPYAVAEQVAKKRYVFGQGVQEQENIVAANNGNLSYVDFPFAGYSSTIRYPDRTKWNDGFYNNIIANYDGISLPQYILPQLSFNNTTNLSESEKNKIYENFYDENYSIQDEEYPYISMDPTSSYILDETYGTIYFSTINQTSYQTKSLHSILRASDDVTTRQSILYISNNIDTNVFEAYINSGSIQYRFNDTVIKSETISASSYFAVGINFDKIEQNYGTTVGSFFSRPETLSLNFSGKQQDVFLGKIFSLTINNEFFTDKDGDPIFNQYGFAIKTFDSSLYDYIGSYTLLPKSNNLSMFLDIGVSGYWENSIPLSYFGKYITQSNGDRRYDLDLVQFNIDAPTSVFLKSNESSSIYQNSLATNVFITVQEVSEIGDFVYTQYLDVEDIGLDRILDLGNQNDFTSKKFKINDGTIIYPPKNIYSFTNYYITVHIEISSKGINTENINIKNMGLAALSFDEGEFYSIDTPAAGKFYPVVKSEDQYVYKRNIPVVIDNESSPYLYLSGDSGISVLPEVDGNLVKGISVPINQSLKLDQEVVGLQMFLMFSEDSMFTEKRNIGKIISSNKSYDIVLDPENDQRRAFLYIYDSESGEQFLTAKFFLNGKLVNNVVLEPLIWNYISISLQENAISLNGIIAEIEIYSGLRVDNIASFVELNPIKQQLIAYDSWNIVDDQNWTYWSSSATWTQVLDETSLEVTVLSLDGSSLFDTYAGLSSAVANDDSAINVNFDSVVILNDITWDTYLV